MATTNEIASEIEIFLIKLPNLFFPYFKNWVNPTRKVTTKANGICHLLKCAITSEFGASLPSASDLKPSIFVSLNKSINGPPNGSARIFQIGFEVSISICAAASNNTIDPRNIQNSRLHKGSSFSGFGKNLR